jgi:hypothetical protein
MQARKVTSGCFIALVVGNLLITGCSRPRPSDQTLCQSELPAIPSSVLWDNIHSFLIGQGYSPVLREEKQAVYERELGVIFRTGRGRTPVPPRVVQAHIRSFLRNEIVLVECEWFYFSSPESPGVRFDISLTQFEKECSELHQMLVTLGRGFHPEKER